MRKRPLAAAVSAVAMLLAVPAVAAARPEPTPTPEQAADRYVATAGLTSPGVTVVRGTPQPGTRGLTYVAYERRYLGLPVVGGDFVVVTDARGRVVDSAVAYPGPISVPGDPTGADVVYAPGGPRFARAGESADRRTYTDPATGAVIASFDQVSHDVGHGYHNGQVDLATTAGTLKDPGRDGLACGPDTTKVPYTNSTTTWGNGDAKDLVTACVDAYYAAAKEYDMLRDWLGRSGIDGTGKAFPLYVGWDDANAYWYTGSTYARFGHNQNNTRWLTSLDVVGHELGHAIFQHTPGGYGTSGENYPLNEATADVFGVLTEFYANNPNDPGDYDIGEEVDFGGDGKPIRYMYDSSKAGQLNCYTNPMPNNDYYSAGGPLRHWFYLTAEGSRPANGRPTSPTCDNSTVTGLSLRTAGEIFYNALLRKTSTWDYAAVRRDTLAAARQLFPNSCAEFTAVRAAWNAVSVPAQAGEATCTGTPSPTTSPKPTGSPKPTASPTSAGRTFTDGTARPINDLATTTGSVTTSLTGPAASPVTLTITLQHTCAEDLTITLRAPDNKTYPVLASRSGTCTRWSGARTFTVPAVTSPAGGTWKLLVADDYRRDTGTLTSWTITL
ncbi:zinc metalloprotease [Longispora fulva]|uniref:P/Homo B domain-containing protein n=1 Tax=Longispora fulva TaxID=619741 RepID=A0A8J7KUH9_9ACTN|nr:M4 family metallopeptidase [Longispora fulva]MBG6141882.1 hypothetical protein [Longispora fulva]GIG58962.1 zinc metalloprotease [Longispora fulva]